MLENQPKGLFALALANTGERFGYYTMLAVFALFLRENFNLSAGNAGMIYSIFLALVYLMPLAGGAAADKFGYGKMVTAGIIIMFFGYLFLAVPLGGSTVGMVSMLLSLVLISFGTGLFKGNLQVMVGNLYDDERYSSQRDSGFSIFYMAINIGALFAPTAAVKIHDWGKTLGYSNSEAYHFSFAVACASLVVSIIIYYLFRYTFRHVEGDRSLADTNNKQSTGEKELTKEETTQRIVALCLVFAVVIFFWMAFHQNGLTLTFFADEFTQKSSEGMESMVFDVTNLVAIVFIVYAAFGFVQSKTGKGKLISAVVAILALAFLCYKYSELSGSVAISAPIFQQFNPFYVVALTPVSMAIFGYLASKGKEPSAPRKIAYGMLVAGVAYALMIVASIGLPTPDEQMKLGSQGSFVSVNWLIGTYLILTFGELLLSPMGISFVSKVAPPKYKGLMMGGWFVATALGNLLVSVGGYLWGSIPLTVVWSVFIALCILSAIFMFVMMKQLEKVSK